jgi:serine/threonine-protein kinase
LKILHVWDDPEKPEQEQESSLPANLGFKPETAPVGTYPRDVTAQGIFDMTGNVREWCRDVWKPYEAGAPLLVDPQWLPPSFAASDTTPMVVRGGWFYSPLDEGTTTFRPDGRKGQDVTYEIGFRIVIECPEIPPDLR